MVVLGGGGVLISEVPLYTSLCLVVKVVVKSARALEEWAAPIPLLASNVPPLLFFCTTLDPSVE